MSLSGAIVSSSVGQRQHRRSIPDSVARKQSKARAASIGNMSNGQRTSIDANKKMKQRKESSGAEESHPKGKSKTTCIIMVSLTLTSLVLLAIDVAMATNG